MKKFMFAAMAALVLVSCGGEKEKVDSQKIKDSIAKVKADSIKADSIKKAQAQAKGAAEKAAEIANTAE